MALFSRSALVACSVAASVTLLACAGTERWRPTVGASAVVADSFEADVSALGYTLSGDTDYSSIELVVGSTASVDEDRRVGQVELRLGRAKFHEAEAYEVLLGGRWYFTRRPVVPYVGFGGVFTIFDDIEGLDVGNQFGARLGAGVEIDLGRVFYLDIGGDYTLPISAAESDSIDGVSVETEVYGFALRVGIGFRF